MCGGTSPCLPRESQSAGLSPRVRGNRSQRMAQGESGRSIPACAGEPLILPAAASLFQVYPRVCGGTQIQIVRSGIVLGLSPRVRGNLHAGYRGLSPLRSIPACAGEPVLEDLREALVRVYPRVCGGTAFTADDAILNLGLSPRVRGNPSSVPRLWSRKGSIPACAGEPVSSAFASSAFEVYPRVCGGTARGATPPAPVPGLSPRVRGNRLQGRLPGEPEGSIPACAGEPDHGGPQRCTSWVYPRVCGGTAFKGDSPENLKGLSPRVRGNPPRQPPVALPPGSIPACAGEPFGVAT